ncbi:MAG: hypothetical protein HWN51_06635, partial [Desulfobacterales bacterium]|nr:hypothetical protein [Desulfobacterales bacterium]
MSEVRYEALAELVKEVKRGAIAPVYLLYGDEFLCKSAFKALLDAVVPPKEQALNYEALDGATANIHEMVERLNTFPLLPGAKVIAVHGTNVFYSRVTVDDLLYRSREAFEKQSLKESARYFIRMLSVAGLSLEDVADEDRERLLDKCLRDGQKAAKEGFGPWLDRVVDYCLREQMSLPTHQDDADELNEAVVRGFPETNHLILATEFVDKRCKLYKTIKTIGVAIDCSVPKGDRVADKRQQKEVLKAHMRKTLRSVGKTMAPGGFEALYEKTGGGLRNFNNELEKLISFVGGRKEILADDIEDASQRTKQDPIYELSNAIGERDTHKALFLVDSLLKSNFFPLQILSAVTGQVRKLILARDFIRCEYGDGWKRDLSYGTFQKTILPELNKREGDLLASKAHPFVVYKALMHSDNYTLEELAGALEILLDADIRLKTSGHNARVVLEHAILRI